MALSFGPITEFLRSGVSHLSVQVQRTAPRRRHGIHRHRILPIHGDAL